jgi:hypothetical protein
METFFTLAQKQAPAAMKQVLDPSIAKVKFQKEVEQIGESSHEVPQCTRVSWHVVSSVFPILKAELLGLLQSSFTIVLDCVNYDYEAPVIRFEVSGKRTGWKGLQNLARFYPHANGVSYQDILVYSNGEGFVCREGNFGYHVSHSEPNWLEIRPTARGRLYFIIENSLDALDLVTNAKQ